MILTVLAFYCCTTFSASTPTAAAAPAAVEPKSRAVAALGEEMRPAKPDAPTPKVSASFGEDTVNELGGEMIVPASEPFIRAAIKPATTESYETPRRRKLWYGLMAANHGAAAFDAWTTRRAVSSGYAVEGNPLERPFANSGAIYATTQLCPVLMDYLGHRMMRSTHPWIRRIWWVPQSASAGLSFGAGIHNYTVVH